MLVEKVGGKGAGAGKRRQAVCPVPGCGRAVEETVGFASGVWVFGCDGADSGCSSRRIADNPRRTGGVLLDFCGGGRGCVVGENPDGGFAGILAFLVFTCNGTICAWMGAAWKGDGEYLAQQDCSVNMALCVFPLVTFFFWFTFWSSSDGVGFGFFV